MMDDLKRETKRSLELTHKNIVRIYDFVSGETPACISMEYIDGNTLSNIRIHRQNKVFDTPRAARLDEATVEALDCAHSDVRFVDRDLKPSRRPLAALRSSLSYLVEQSFAQSTH